VIVPAKHESISVDDLTEMANKMKIGKKVKSKDVEMTDAPKIKI